MLTTTELIERMTPTALAEAIASIEQSADGNCNVDELDTTIALYEALANNVGIEEADELLAAAR